mgnify:CR=1 FL=1
MTIAQADERRYSKFFNMVQVFGPMSGWPKLLRETYHDAVDMVCKQEFRMVQDTPDYFDRTSPACPDVCRALFRFENL